MDWDIKKLFLPHQNSTQINTFFISAGAGPNALYSTGASGSASTPFWWHSRLYNPEGGGQPGPGGTGGPHMSSLNPDGTSNYQRARMPYITGETFQQHLQKEFRCKTVRNRRESIYATKTNWSGYFVFRFIRFRLFAHLRAVADTHKVRCPKVPHQTIVSKVN